MGGGHKAYYPRIFREGLSGSTKDLKTVGVQAWAPAGNLQNVARSHSAGSQHAGNLQITRLFHTKKVPLESIRIASALPYSKQLHLLDFEGCEFYVALLLKWCSSPPPLNSNTHFFSHGLYNVHACCPKLPDMTYTDILNALSLLLSRLSVTPFLTRVLASHSQLYRFFSWSS